jgi:hypothetical protein
MKLKQIIILLLAFYINSMAQPVWKPLISFTQNQARIDGGSVRAFMPTSSSSILICGEFDTLRSNSWVNIGSPLIEWNSVSFQYLDCSPGIDSLPIQNPSVYCITAASDTIYWTSGGLFAVGGRFTRSGCGSGQPMNIENAKNIQMWDQPFNWMYANFHQMTVMDTVFAIAMTVNKPPAICANPAFKTYVAAKKTFCEGFPFPQTGDTTSYIAMYDPYLTCNYNPTPNYMQGGTNGPVYAINALDSANVYAGGLFDSAGVIKAKNIAKWNGVNWDSLGGGVNGKVKALTYYRGKLYVGGVFSMAGNAPANNIAVWDGIQWSALGNGVNGAVYALTIHKDNLIVGGAFSMAGSAPVSNIARWDGVQWSALGGGRNNEVYAVASFQSCVYAGGNFTGGTADTAKYIAFYNDSTIGTLSISENHTYNKLKLYPNPSTGIFTLQKPTDAKATVVVYDVLGNQCLSQSINEGEGNKQIDMSNFAKGIYHLQLLERGKVYSQKVVLH